MAGKFVLSVVLFIYLDGVSSQSGDFNITNGPIAQPLRSNVENHRQAFDKTLEEVKAERARLLQQVGLSKIQGGAINSHRPQYGVNNPDNESNKRENPLSYASIDDVDNQDDYKPSNHLRNKHNQIKTVLVRLLEKNEQKRNFAQVMPIIRMLTPAQRLAMASLVTKQLSTGARNPGLNLDQVKAMFGNNPNVTSDLMLPILLDIANMIKDAKDHMRVQENNNAPQAQQLRRSFNVDEEEDEEEERYYEDVKRQDEMALTAAQPKSLDESAKSAKIAAKIPAVITNANLNGDLKVEVEIEDESMNPVNATISNNGRTMTVMINGVNETIDIGNYSMIIGNGTEPGEELPVAEELKAVSRFVDRNGNVYVIARPPWVKGPPKLMITRSQSLNRKSNNDFLINPPRRRVPGPGRKTPLEIKQKCDMFTNTLCLDSNDYPSDAIMGSIRRNQAAVQALLADFPEISADSAIDGVTAKQENKYTPEYYNTINRREDGSNPTAGFMCPSTVKYARPQKARATSGQWKYIVNTGEHTQTLRLEKCLRPREPCTYLTDNFKSKCVQVYNYHRLLTWDQQNGLHMDIFKVPTCCSCHIEGYSVAFPPHSPRIEATSERFPGEEINHDHNGAYEDVQPSIRHTSKYPVSPQDSLSVINDNHNRVHGSNFKQVYSDEGANHFDSSSSNFHPDQFQHQSNTVRNVKKPPRVPTNSAALPSYLEPPNKPGNQNLNNYIKHEHKYKQNSGHYKRGAPTTQSSKRPSRRPLRKKTSGNDDQLIGASNIHENPTIVNMESFEDINESIDIIERTPQKSTPPTPIRPSTPRTKSSSIKFSIKNIAQTTERYRPKISHNDQPKNHKEATVNRRVNYNYHPIIDFFEDGSKKNMASDRMDTGSVYFASEESEWKPMANPLALPLKDKS